MYANFEDSFPNSTDFGIALISENTMRSIGGYSSYYSVKYPDTAQEVVSAPRSTQVRNTGISSGNPLTQEQVTAGARR